MNAILEQPIATLLPLEDEAGGHEVRWSHGGAGRAVQYVYEDICGGWRPYNAYGQAIGAGERTYATPIQAAYGPRSA